MQHLIDKLITHLWMVIMMAMAFIASMGGFWLRVRRDQQRRRDKEQTRFE